MKRTRRNPDVTDTPAFRRWFGKSAMVNAEGRPWVLYHQTRRDFTKFIPGGLTSDLSGRAIWLTPYPHNIPSGHNAYPEQEGTRVLPVYARIERPLYITDADEAAFAERYKMGSFGFPLTINDAALAALRRDGYDGIVYGQWRNPEGFDLETGRNVEIIAFDPTQIKSATGNRGTFDPEDADIRHNPRRARVRAHAPMAIGEVVRKRARHNPDYPNVQVLKGRIVSPEGSILVRKIGEGQFSTAYLSDERTPRVFVVTSKRAKEKEILAQAYALDPKNPHLPKVSRYGFTKTGKTLWTMPYYTMLPKAKTATEARSDAKALTACRAGVFKRKSRRVTSSDALNEAVVDCARVELASRPLLIRALDALRWAARLHETYLFEFQARNLAIDDKGHLILLDVLFDWKA